MPKKKNEPVAQEAGNPFLEAIRRKYQEAQNLFNQYNKVTFTDDPKKGMEAYEKLSEANYIRQAVNEVLIKRVQKLSAKQIKGMYESFVGERFKERVKADQFLKIMMGEKVEGEEFTLQYTDLFNAIGTDNVLGVLDEALKPDDKDELIKEVNGIVSPNDPTFPRERLTVCPEDQQITALENSIAVNDPEAGQKKALLKRARSALTISSSEASSFYQFKANSIDNSNLKGLENEIDHETNAIFTEYVKNDDKTGMKDILRKDRRGNYTDAQVDDDAPLTDEQWREMQSLRSGISPEVKNMVKKIMEEFSKFDEKEFEKFGLKESVTKRDGTVVKEYSSESGNKLYCFGILAVAQSELRKAIKSADFDRIKEKTEKYESVRGQMDKILNLVHGGADFPCWGGNVTPTRQINNDGTHSLPPEYLKDYAGINKVNSFFQLHMMCKKYDVDIDRLLDDPVNTMAKVEERLFKEYSPEGFDSNVSKLVVGLSGTRNNAALMGLSFTAGFIMRSKGALAGLAKDEEERKKLIGAFGVTEVMIAKKRSAYLKLWNELQHLTEEKTDALYKEAFLSEKGKFDVFGTLEKLKKDDWKEQLNQDERIKSMSLTELHDRIEENIQAANALPDSFGDHDKTAKFLRMADDISKTAMFVASQDQRKSEAYQKLVRQHKNTVRSYLQLEDKNTYYKNYNTIKHNVDKYDPDGKKTVKGMINGDPNATFTAAEWIEAHKRSIKQKGQEYWDAQGSDFCIARIMAARQLSNATRGKASTLNKKLTARQIDEQALKLMANENFYSFVEQLTKEKSKLTSMLTKRYTHGGKLDDMFTKYMCSLPAGEMRNDPMLERWMPTVKDRIEVLQKQAGVAIKKNDNETVQKAAVEIMLLREMAHVRRGGEGLKVKVPVNSNGKKDLSLGVRTDIADYETQEKLKKADIAKYVRVGHGGKLTEMYLNPPQKKIVVPTNANVARTNANVARTNANVARNNADVARNNANVVRSNTNVVKTNADVVKTNANVVKSNTMKNVDIKKKQVTLS